MYKAKIILTSLAMFGLLGFNSQNVRAVTVENKSGYDITGGLTFSVGKIRMSFSHEFELPSGKSTQVNIAQNWKKLFKNDEEHENTKVGSITIGLQGKGTLKKMKQSVSSEQSAPLTLETLETWLNNHKLLIRATPNGPRGQWEEQ